MKPLTQFNRGDLDFIRKDMNEALEAVAEKYGISLKASTISYSATTINVKVEGAILSESGVSEELLANAKVWGLDVNKTGPQGEKLVGYRRTARRQPWIFQRYGKQYKCDLPYAQLMFGAAKGEAPKSQGPIDDMGFEEAPR